MCTAHSVCVCVSHIHEEWQLYEPRFWRRCSCITYIMFNSRKMNSHHPTLTGSLCQARASPAHFTQFNPTLFFQSFHSLNCWCPPLILPRAEHSSPSSNTASRIPALLNKTLPFFFRFLFFFFPKLLLCRAATSGMHTGTSPKSCGGENDALCL